MPIIKPELTDGGIDQESVMHMGGKMNKKWSLLSLFLICNLSQADTYLCITEAWAQTSMPANGSEKTAISGTNDDSKYLVSENGVKRFESEVNFRFFNSCRLYEGRPVTCVAEEQQPGWFAMNPDRDFYFFRIASTLDDELNIENLVPTIETGTCSKIDI